MQLGSAAGVQVEVLRDQMGHSTAALTLDVYTFTDDRGDVAERIEALLVEPPETEPRPASRSIDRESD